MNTAKHKEPKQRCLHLNVSLASLLLRRIFKFSFCFLCILVRKQLLFRERGMTLLLTKIRNVMRRLDAFQHSWKEEDRGTETHSCGSQTSRLDFAELSDTGFCCDCPCKPLWFQHFYKLMSCALHTSDILLASVKNSAQLIIGRDWWRLAGIEQGKGLTTKNTSTVQQSDRGAA